MSFRERALARPIPTAVSCAALQFFITVAILLAGASLPPEAAGKVRLLAFASTIVLPLVLAQLLGLWRLTGLTRLNFGPLFWVSLLSCAVFLGMGIRLPEGSSVASDVFMQLINAFGEELLFRGIILGVLLSVTKWKGIILSSLLFGSMHLIHGFMGGEWSEVLAQALFTSAAGAMFAAVRFETGSLWAAIALSTIKNG